MDEVGFIVRRRHARAGLISMVAARYRRDEAGCSRVVMTELAGTAASRGSPLRPVTR
jgi:hypothetical protein